MSDILKHLIDNKVITQEQAINIKKENVNTKKDVETILVNNRILKDSELLKIKSNYYNLPEANLVNQNIPKETLNIITQDLAQNYKYVVFNKTGRVLSVAMVDPQNYNARDAIDFVTRKKNFEIKYFVTTNSSIDYALKQYTNISSELQEAIGVAQDKFDDFDTEADIFNTEDDSAEFVQNAPISKMVSVIIRHAVEGSASDIHIEPTRNEVRVRYRVDGVLYTSLTLPKYTHTAIVSRIKVIGGLKIDETRIPQDGRIRLKIDGGWYDFRISSLPVSEGEKIVIRILDASKGAPTLEELGIEGRNLDIVNAELKSPNGMILVTGPTGSGKSTSLFSILSILNNEEVNIVTLEDPIEYTIKGVNHSQVKPEIGYNFVNGLRSFLRQDPDIIMVGEIRDEETAELSVHAALTGHLILSTLHTNDAIGTVPRILDMHVEPFLLSSCLNVIIAQRLVRRVCEYCKEEVMIDEKVKNEYIEKIKDLPPEILKKYKIDLSKEKKFYKGKGCVYCGDTGYKGRISINEVFKITDEVKALIEKGSPSEDYRALLAKQDFVTMEQDGIIKALKGITTLSDVISTTKD
ncbi:type II/IV secretion system protein [bacterium]|nr:type II/IV secretion system protein [bacterium]